MLLRVPFLFKVSDKHSLHGNIHERAIAIGSKFQSNDSIDEDERVPSIS